MKNLTVVKGKTVFISDAHIKGIDSQAMKTLCSFLNSLPSGNTEAVVIVGDLFDFWIGCKDIVYYEYLPILNALMRLKKKRIKIIYIEGNHDFSMGPFFTEVLEAEVYASEVILNMAGKSIYITHGDMVNKKEYGYRLWRWFLRSRLFRWAVGLIPPYLVFRIGSSMSKTSRRYARKNFDLNAILKGFAMDRWKEGYDGVVMGHLHTPQFLEEEVDGASRFYVNLGDWNEHLTYLVYEKGRCRLESADEVELRNG